MNIVIVDSQPSDYAALQSSTESVRKTLIESGRASLSLALDGPIDAWFIAVRLPDMTGFELHELLRRRHASECFVLVGDDYRPGDERQARAAGASYLCKPPQAWWLELHHPSDL